MNFKYFTFRKSFNLLLLFLSYWVSRIIKKPIHFGHAFSLSVEPVNYCNLRCPQCPTGLMQITRNKGYMDLMLFEKLIVQQKSSLSYLILYLQGEPMLHPKFDHFARLANRNSIYTAVSTNGHFLNKEMVAKIIESGLNRLIVSVDGASQAVYEKYRVGGKLSKVLEGMRNVVEMKKDAKVNHPRLEMQFIVLGVNETEIEKMKNLQSEIGADRLILKTAQVYDFENGSPFLTTLNQYSRYEKQTNGQYRIKNKMAKHCWRMWSGAVITEDGKVLPCCFDKDAKHVMGNIQDEPFEQIWRNEKYTEFRRKIAISRSLIPMCSNCTEGTFR